MGDSKQKPYKKHSKPKPKKIELTPEQQVAAAAARALQVAAEAVERERVELYGKNVKVMSHRQLRRELAKTIKREYSGRPPEPQAGLNILFGTVLLAVLDRTITSPVFEADKDGKPTRVARLDQINQLGRLHPYPR